MKIVFISHYFQPEPNFFIGLPFARELVRRGHRVQVLTGFPNYPGGRIYDGYQVKFLQREVMEGIPIIRVPLYPSHDRSSLKRILSYVSLSFSQAAIGPFAVESADIAFVSQGPATIGLPAIAHKLLRRIPYVYNVQDLWPDSLLSTGMFHSKIGLRIVNWWCHRCYARASKIVVIAPGMKNVLIARGVPREKTEVVYNWCDEEMIRGEPADFEVPKFLREGGKFNIVFAGNIGKAQAMDAVLDAAKLLQDDCPDLRFVLIGGGVEAEPLKARVKEMDLRNVLFEPRRPVSEMGAILRRSDVLFVHLRDDPLFRITIPSKTQAYLAAGRPILIGVKGDASDLVLRAQAGVDCEPENPQSIAQAARMLYSMDRQELKVMGDNGRRFYDENLSFKTAVDHYIEIFRCVAG